jgi:hypothetical protein
MRMVFFLRDKYEIDDDEIDDDVVADGNSVRVPLMLCDGESGTRMFFTDAVPPEFAFGTEMDAGVDHRPGHRYTTDAAARDAALDARDGMIQKLRDAWKRWPVDAAGTNFTPGPNANAGSDLGPDEQRRQAAQQQYVRQISEAWRNPPGVLHLKPVQIGAGPASMVEPDRGGR